MEEGVAARIMHLKQYHHSDVMGELADATGIVCGSPTHNNGILPLMADFLTYMKGLRPEGRVGAAFGSYGWSGECINIMTDWLKSAKVEVIEPGAKAKNVPDHAKLAECKEQRPRRGDAGDLPGQLDDRKMLLLDEFTANIDSIREEKIIDQILNRMEDKTIIIISHRLSSVRIFSRIIYIADGKIAANRNHKTLPLSFFTILV